MAATATTPPDAIGAEYTSVITVRLPKEFHAALKRLAHKQYMSLNTFCIRALQQRAKELELDPVAESAP